MRSLGLQTHKKGLRRYSAALQDTVGFENSYVVCRDVVLCVRVWVCVRKEKWDKTGNGERRQV